MAKKRWEIIGAPFDYGSCYRGVKDGPAALREAGLTKRIGVLRTLGIDVVDGGDVAAPETVDSQRKPTGTDEMIAYAPTLMERLDAILRSGAVPIVLGGDHSVSIPTFSAVAGFRRNVGGADAPVGLIWVDAHPDLETPGEESTNDLNAMSAAHLLDLGIPELRSLHGFAPKVRPEHLIYIGLRDVVPQERRIIREKAITAYTMSDVERLGIAGVCDEAFRVLSDRTDVFVLSFDIDACDPTVAPAVDYPQPGGLTHREAMVIMESASKAEKLALIEFVEANPSKDHEGTTSRLLVRLIHRFLCGPVV